MMKKVLTVLGSLLIFAGLKGQAVAPVVVKKETTKPATQKPEVIPAATQTSRFKKTNTKAIKKEFIKKTPEAKPIKL